MLTWVALLILVWLMILELLGFWAIPFELVIGC
jgi:hypothetical protein